jgi:ABC-2 type transport system ATP-binding protein
MQMLANVIAEPRVTLLDEPLTSLDVVVAEEMKDLLRTLKPGRVTILSTHILDLAIDLCDEIVLLSKGRLERISHENLSDDSFKERIIMTLRGEE